MKKKIGYMLFLVLILFMLSACRDEGDTQDNNAEETSSNETTESNEKENNTEGNSGEQGEMDTGEIESEIFSALVGGTETYSVQKNGVDIQDESFVHSRLVVNLETDNVEFDEMVRIAEEDTEIIADLLSELDMIKSAEVKWQFNYHGNFYTFNLGRDNDQLVVTSKELDEDRLNKHIETFVPASEME